VQLYLEYGDEIFHTSVWHKIKTAGGVRDEKYPATELEERLEEYFGNTNLSALLKPCVITAYNIRDRYAHFFRQQRAVINPDHDFPVKEVARATSAAPTYFECARVKSLNNKYYPLIDGGVFANNPSLCAYAEARIMDFEKPDGSTVSHPGAKDMFVISLSTGTTKQKYLYSEAKDYGMVQWIKPLIDIMMSGNSETVTYQLKQIWDTLEEEHKADFVRLNPDRGEASEDMDDGSKENLKKLAAAGEAFAKAEADQIEFIAKQLIAFN
jgi:patatin-like phospholipase/acyl hydrolase